MSKQQPLSLNQRHTQMLFDLSASNSKPPPEEKTKMEARQRIIENDDVPNFSVFEDSDSSPSPVRFSSNSGGAVLDDQLKIRKGGNNDVLNFSAIADFSPDSSTSSPIVDFEEIPTSQSECSEDYLAPLDSPSAGSVEKEIEQANSGTEVPWAEEEVSYSSKYSEDRLAPLCSGIVEKDINQPKSRTEVPWEEEDPLFSRIDDSRSSRSVEMEPSKGMPENCELSDKGQNDYEKTSNWSTTMHSTSNLPGEKEKPMKVKIKGRRRLCKISKEDNNGSGDMNLTDNEESKLFELADFDSPPQAKKAIQSEKGGRGNEIRDILNDLSSRFEVLSIERNRPPKHCDLTKEEEFPDYQSAGSTFSLSSGSSSDSTKESRKGGAIPEEFLKENDFDRESESGCVIGKLNGIRAFGGAPKRSEVKQVVGKSQPMKNSFSSHNVVEEVGGNDSDSDCVIVGDKNAVNQVGRNNRKSRADPKYSDDVDASDIVSEEERTFTLSGPKFTYKLPGKIANMLYPHQRDGLKWLWSLHCLGKGGILGDDMGLGKTMQICGFLAGLFKSKLITRVMIVAPKTLLPHWIKELSVVGLSEKIREYFATSPKIRDYELQYVLQDKGILLTTYDIVRNNVKSLCGDGCHLDRDEELTWDYMILDEGHLIKNPSTQRAKSLHEIPCAHRIIISGTPIQNNLKELWALFNFCCPGLLGDKKWFKKKYEQLILRGNDKSASDRDKRIGSAIAKELREHIQPYFLRRLKSEVFSDDASTSAKLSKKNEIIVWLKLTNCQRQLYEAFLKSEIVLSACDSSPLAALTILKKICDHPLLLTKRAAEEVLEGMDSTSNQEDHVVAERLVMQMANVTEKHDLEDIHDVSCKMAFILALLDNLIPSGHRVLIFSQTRKMLNLIQDSLISNGFQLMRIDGTTKAADRLKIVNDYQEGHGAPIFLLTSQVGGLGLTLTKADRVIVVDPAWNPSTDNQSVDRAYRIGQTKDVVVYRLMTCGTVEEKIYRKQVYKGGLFKTATEHKEQIRYFSQQDLRELFSLPKDGGFDISLTQQQLNEEHDHEHKMEEALKSHVKFLETLGIAGVSQHSLLFSKTAPVSAVQDEDEVRIARGMISGDSSSSYTSAERVVDASQYAFKPKDVKLPDKYVPIKSGPTEADIRDRIRRLTQILANTATISKLPDKGEKIRRQISDLHKELDDIRMEKEKKNEVIDLDDLSGRFNRVVNV